MYRIMYSYEGREAEEVDTAETLEEAEELLIEYALSFGCYVTSKSKVWIQESYHGRV